MERCLERFARQREGRLGWITALLEDVARMLMRQQTASRQKLSTSQSSEIFRNISSRVTARDPINVENASPS